MRSLFRSTLSILLYASLANKIVESGFAFCVMKSRIAILESKLWVHEYQSANLTPYYLVNPQFAQWQRRNIRERA